jgi:tRNA (cytidine/uridine-2'-O-)-methyltransferase
LFNIVLVEPEIPANTGNVARTCAVTNCNLHLVKPLGFSINDKHLKRAGLDYWNLLNVQLYENLEDFFLKNSGIEFYLVTTKGNNSYTDKNYRPGSYFLFGKETKGLPEKLLFNYPDKCIKIPMLNNKSARSLNLSNSVAIVTYEALRQIGFPNMK